MSSSLSTHVRRIALAGSAVFLATLAWAGPANAADSGATSGVVATGGGRVNVRTPELGLAAPQADSCA